MKAGCLGHASRNQTEDYERERVGELVKPLRLERVKKLGGATRCGCSSLRLYPL